jgi:hypothetical protein
MQCQQQRSHHRPWCVQAPIVISKFFLVEKIVPGFENYFEKTISMTPENDE